jgi:hypothetical protein
MPRVCGREGCGKCHLRKNGCRTIIDTSAVLNARTWERMQAKRQQAKAGLCPLCGQRGQRLTPNTLVPRHIAQ